MSLFLMIKHQSSHFVSYFGQGKDIPLNQIMVEWTEAAKRELERYLTHVRQRLSPEEVDKNEVEDDLRRHITEKAHSSGLGIITREDIQHFAEQMGLPAAEVKQMQQRTKDRKSRPKTKWLRFDLGGLAFFGIILPIIALALELFFRNGECRHKISTRQQS
jgi:hypothetical protein